MGDDDWKRRKRDRKRYDDDDDDDRYEKRRERKDYQRHPSTWESLLQKLDSSVATSLIKLVTTGVISLTALGLIGIYALAGIASTPLIVPTLALSALSTGFVWIFGGRRKMKTIESAKADATASVLEKLKATLAGIDERLGNLEMLGSVDRLIAERQADEMAKKELNVTYEAQPSEATQSGSTQSASKA